MDVRIYKAKQMKRALELLQQQDPKDAIATVIMHLELIICDIEPYSLRWRCGYIKSLRRAISILKALRRDGKI